MTDITSEIEAPARQAAAETQPESARRGGKGGWLTILLLAVLVIAALLSALWYQRQEFQQGGRELAGRLSTVETQLQQTQRQADEARDIAQGQQAKVQALEEKLTDLSSRYQVLEQAWQNLTDEGGDVVLSNDLDRILTLASQQLRLAGQVGNAIVALETAQARLASADRPGFAMVLQAVNGDLERLRMTPQVDIPALSRRVDALVRQIDTLPLLAPGVNTVINASPAAQPVAVADDTVALPAVPVVDSDASWWVRWRAEMETWPGRLGHAIAGEFSNLVKVQRIDAPDALLLSPDQASQLRSNLRQRLLTAQVALLARQPDVWKSELDIVARALSQYFDMQNVDVARAFAQVEALAQAPIKADIPDIGNSLHALEAARAKAALPAESGAQE